MPCWAWLVGPKTQFVMVQTIRGKQKTPSQCEPLLETESLMLLASLALVAAQPALASGTVHAAPAPCNPDAMKSIACNAQRHAPSSRTAASAPVVCNPDPLKGAACHAHLAQARAEARSNAPHSEELAAAN